MFFENINTFSQFIPAKRATLLPIELLSFSAKLDNDQVRLEWETGAELNNKGFHIQRLESTGDWKTISFVNGKGDTDNGHEYIHFDKNVISGKKYFYRLQQEDFDGKLSYSTIEVVTMPNQNTVSISPNPAKDFIEVSFGDKAFGTYQIQLHDNLGRTLTRFNLDINSTQIQRIDLTNYPKAVYFISVLKAGDQIENFKFVKK